MRSLNLQKKVVKQFENGTNPQRLCNKYLHFLPAGAKVNDAFNLSPLHKNKLNQPNHHLKNCSAVLMSSTIGNYSLRRSSLEPSRI